MHHHDTQWRLWNSRARFNIAEASRRSGKTELAKRSGVLDMIAGSRFPDFRVIFGAPTRDQAKQIFWDDIKALIPSGLIAHVSESELEVKLIHGPRARVVGMDEPRRIEGPPLDRLFLDEMAEMKEGTFDRHVRGTLATRGREGKAWLFGVPRIGHTTGGGKEFKYLADIARTGKDPDFAYFNWDAYGIVDDKEIEAAKATMDPAIFAQEFLAKRVSLSGRAYFTFEREVHGIEALPYKPGIPLIFCFDFGLAPGVAVVCQEHRFRERPGAERQDRPEVADEITACIGEVHIPRDSNTPTVCRKLLADWGPPGPDNPQGKNHQGPVWCYGDPSGGARTTKIDGDGTDWTEIRAWLKPTFKERLSIRGPGTEQGQRQRMNALRARLRTADGKVHLLIDPEKCPKLLEDFEETTIKPGSDGELHKPSGTPYTHLTDSLAYFCVRAHPITGASVKSESFR